jgi:uncharacterized protein
LQVRNGRTLGGECKRVGDPSEISMNSATVLDQLAGFEPLLAARYGVIDRALLGSAVRDSARPDSDVDILVSFDGPATSQR